MSGTEQTSPELPSSPNSATDRQHQWTEATLNRKPRWSPQQEVSVTEPQAGSAVQRRSRRTAAWVSVVVCVVLLLGAAVPIALKMRSAPTPNAAQSIRYLGLYEPDSSSSYAGIAAFTTATGIRPNVLTYYSSWLEPFQTSFATTAAEHGAVTARADQPVRRQPGKDRIWTIRQLSHQHTRRQFAPISTRSS